MTNCAGVEQVATILRLDTIWPTCIHSNTNKCVCVRACACARERVCVRACAVRLRACGPVCVLACVSEIRFMCQMSLQVY